jgi:hypothetical protein
MSLRRLSHNRSRYRSQEDAVVQSLIRDVVAAFRATSGDAYSLLFQNTAALSLSSTTTVAAPPKTVTTSSSSMTSRCCSSSSSLFSAFHLHPSESLDHLCLVHFL